MKIDKIYINAFGKFKDYTLTIGDGFNVIYGENEKGKSTLMAFVKMMFYGTAGKKGQSLISRPRLKYKPWNSDGEMGGRIYFSHNGHNYCLERLFGKSDSTDKIRLTDTDLGVNLPTDSDIGKSFFGIGISAFERSVFIEAGAPYTHDESGEGELNMKLSNLALTGEEDTSYQTVLNRLEDARYDIISKSGKTGKYPKNISLIEELKEELSSANLSANRRKEIMEKLSEADKKFRALKEEFNGLKELLDLENDFKTKEKIEEYLKVKEKLDALNETLKLTDGTTADEKYVKAVEFCANKVDSLKEKIAEKEEDIAKRKETIRLASERSADELKKELEELNLKAQKITEEKESLSKEDEKIGESLNAANLECLKAQGAKKKFNPLFLGIGAVSFIAMLFSVSGLFNSSILPIVLAALTVLFEVLAFVIKPEDASAYQKAKAEYDRIFSESLNIKNRLTALTQEGLEYTSKISMVTASLNSDTAIKNQRLSELKTCEDDLDSLNEKLKSASDELSEIFGKYKEAQSTKEIRDALSVLTEKAEELKSIKLNLNYISKDLGNISYEEAEEKLKFLSSNSLPEDIDFDATKQKANALNEEIIALYDYRSGLAAELKSQFSKLKEPETLLREIKELEEKSAELKAYHDATALAEEVLSESFSQVRRGYGANLEQKTLDIFSRLTLKNYSGITVSKSLDMTVEKNGIFGMKEAEYLSSGTYDQAYLSLRLAISSLMSDGETLPLFLDDVLSLYDDGRMQAAMEFLKEYSLDTQCLLFTCHGNIKDIAKKENINTIEL